MRAMFRATVFAAIAAVAQLSWGTSPLLAQDTQRYLPKKIKRDNTPPRLIGPQDGRGVDDDTPIIKSLKGLVIVGSPGMIRPGGRHASGVVVADPSLTVPQRVIDAASAHLGEVVSLKSLHQLTKQMVLAYRRADLPIVNVVTPEQDVSNGVVQIIVVVGRLGQTLVEGNRFFPADIYLHGISVRPGDTIYGSELLDNLRQLNRNPFRRVDAIYTPGRGYGTTDVVLRPYEYRPFTLYAGIENTGNETLGEERLFFGGMVGNVLGMDEVFGYQLTTIPEFDDLFAHVVTFQKPVGRRGEIQLLGAHVKSDAQTNVDTRQSGESNHLAGYYLTQLPRWHPEVAHDARIGFEFKQSDNNLEFGGLTVIDTTTEVAQFVLGYSAEKWWSWGHTRFNGDLYLAPGGLTSHNKDAVFREIRADASADYVYGRIGLEHRKDLPRDFRFEGKVVAQFSNENLLASEQLLFGGVSSIRGFGTNLGRADEGVIGRFALFSPGVSVLGPGLQPVPAGFERGSKKTEPAVRTVRDELRLFGFYDHGWGRDVHKLVGQEDVEMSGAGVGLRYDYGRFFSAELAYGWQLKEEGVTEDDDDSFLHFRVTARY